jgi:guanylate cyclase
VVVCNSYLVVLSILISFIWVSTGGLTSTPNDPAFSALYPVVALLLIGRRWAIFWLMAAIGLVVANGILGLIGVDLPVGMNPQWVPWFLILSLIGHAILLYVFVSIFETSRDRAHQQLQVANTALAAEQEKSENLLLNILPREIAAILKNENRTIADHIEGASILFADMVGFTPMTASMTPIEMVELLNSVFSHFDELVETYGVEKIRTIGDSYMVAAGVPRPRQDHAQVMAAMALDMQAYVHTNPWCVQRQIDFRIGINSGPVVAGVIGRKKFTYDLWGDAVNTASRMESHGEPGRIQITAATYELIRRDFVCESRGQVNVKGKGEMETWYLLGVRLGASTDLNGGTNPVEPRQ